jgi:hypothetical protein
MADAVIEAEMTMLDKQSKGVPIDEQANDDVVHLDRARQELPAVWCLLARAEELPLS